MTRKKPDAPVQIPAESFRIVEDVLWKAEQVARSLSACADLIAGDGSAQPLPAGCMQMLHGDDLTALFDVLGDHLSASLKRAEKALSPKESKS